MIVNGVSSRVQHLEDVSSFNVLGKDDFLKLLISQLSNQDPMEPMDNAQFIDQMTQFSSLEQLQNLNENSASSIMLTQSMNNALSTTLIGREVVIQGNIINVSGGKPQGAGFYAGGPGNAEVTIRNGTGAKVRSYTVDVDETGYVDIGWDGEDADGDRVTDGPYTFEVSFVNADGEPVTVSRFITGHVSGVKYMGGNAFLTIDGQQYNLSQVLEIREEE